MKKVLVFCRKAELREKVREAVSEKEVEVDFAQYDEIALFVSNSEAFGRVYARTAAEGAEGADFGVVAGDTDSSVAGAEGAGFGGVGAGGVDVKEISEYQKIFLLTFPPVERQHVMASLAFLAQRLGIEMADDKFTDETGKLYAMWRLAEAGVRVPATAFGPAEFLAEMLETKFGGIGVLKSIIGTKGRDNYLVKSSEELRKILAENPEVQFILQEFIPSEGDFRVVCFDFEAKLAIRRWSETGDHRNNTSLGGKAEIVELTDVLRSLSERTARALNVKFTGVDLIQHRETGEFYILEANRTPQLMSGAFIEEKQKILAEFLAK